LNTSAALLFALSACSGDKTSNDTSSGEPDACTDVWFQDSDGDGFGNPSVSQVACTPPLAYVADATDCDDDREMAYPGAAEVCDEADNDCDGSVDEDPAYFTAAYRDADGDTYGDPDESELGCTHSAGYVSNADDCDDTNNYIAPSAPEYCDDIDNDCDDDVDEDDAVDRTAWHPDADADGYGSAADTVMACAQPADHSEDDRDCDDTNSDIHPDALEVCDDVDNDCDGDIDSDATDALTWYNDTDGDGFGDDDSATLSCDAPSARATLIGGDCDDGHSAEHPDAGERCDDVDNDCDGDIDEEADISDPATWYIDSDGDGAGDALVSTTACAQPSGYVATDDDCDDTSADIAPGASETWYDGTDSDCGDDSDYDADADGYDAEEWSGDDCDDTDSTINPSADELCDEIDNDCDGTSDPDSATDAADWYTDADGDGYGDPDSVPTTSCDGEDGTVDNDNDCDDTVADLSQCTCDLAAVDEPVTVVKAGEIYGAWMADPLETLGEGLYWEMDSYTGSTLTQYPSLEDLVARTGGTTITLPSDFDGTGAAVYDGTLYYNESDTRNLIKFDLATETVEGTLEVIDAGYRNTYPYAWGGYSDIDVAVDEDGLWVLYATAANAGMMVISSIDPDTFTITDTWNTSSAAKRDIGNAFMMCGVLYTVSSYKDTATTIDYAYDTADSTGTSIAIDWINEYTYNSMVDYNPTDGLIYAWDYSVRVTYTPTIE
jgi:Olfactomedin-like domain/Putative metal-binding motif